MQIILINSSGTEIDITSVVSYPLTIRGTIDETLDAANMVIPFVKSDKFSGIDLSEAIKPYTKMKIIEDNITFRFVVSEDNVRVIRYGTPLLYSHNITLVEPTKLLERYTIPDISVTQPQDKDGNVVNQNYLSSNENVSNTSETLTLNVSVPSNDTSILETLTLKDTTKEYTISINSWIKNNQYDYPAIARPPGGVIKSDADTTLTIEPYINGSIVTAEVQTVDVPGGYLTAPSSPTTYSFNFTHTPTTTTDVLSFKVYTTGNYTSTVLGVATDTEDTVTIQKFDVVISTPVTSTRAEVYIYELIDKILSITDVHDINDTTYSQKFTLGETTRNNTNIIAPEITQVKYTLWDSLKEIGDKIKAIPRLGKTDFTTIEFDFIDDYNENQFTMDNFNSKSKALYIQDYINALEINADSVIEEAGTLNTKVEPYQGGYMTVRANADGPIKITDDSAAVKVRQKIYKPTSFIVTNVVVKDSGGNTLVTATDETDIIEYVLEKKKYDATSDQVANQKTDRLSGTLSQGNTIYYEQGGYRFLGLGAKGKKYVAYPGMTSPERALFEALYAKVQRDNTGVTVDDSYNDSNHGNFDDVQFQVTYIPMAEVRANLYKSNYSDFDEKLTRYSNEQARISDADQLGQVNRDTVNRLGKSLNRTSHISRTLSTIPGLGFQNEDGEVVSAYTINLMPTIHTYDLELYPDYSAISTLIGVKSAYRQYQIPDTDVVFRQDVYTEHITISDQDGTPGWSIYESVGLENILQNFSTTTKLTNGGPITYCWARIRNDYESPLTYTGFSSSVEMPVNTTALGNTLSIQTEFFNNFSVDSNLLADGADKYQQDVQYGDIFGQLDSIYFAMYTKGFQSNGVSDSDLYPVYTSAPSASDVMSLIDVRVLKDAREKYGFVQEINFTSDDINNKVYPGMAKYCGLSVNPTDVDLGFAFIKTGFDISANALKLDETKTETPASFSIPRNMITTGGLRGHLTISTTATDNYAGYVLYNTVTKELIYSRKETITSGVYASDIYFIPNKT